MAHFVDRRSNPKDKSLGNRRRFVRRVRAVVKRAVNQSVRKRNITDVDGEEQVTVSTDDISEPSFRKARRGGKRELVITGNKSFRAGDRIDKPKSGARGGGRQGSADGEGLDEFAFILSRDEFLDIFFEDLELPDLVKRSLKETMATRPRRAGYSVAGTPANLSVMRTMRNALARRIALKRPTKRDTDRLQQKISELESCAEPTEKQRQDLTYLRGLLDRALQYRRQVPFVDPIDLRYKNFTQQPEPATNAVMFCLMDVSASMGEREKDLAKRFFVLLHLFLKRRYEKIDLVFIRHTQTACEVDEETFFHSRETGGTVVSSALREMMSIMEARYSPADWNIYAAQASDGENFAGDSKGCAELLETGLLRQCQYFAYIEIIDEDEARFLNDESNGLELWRTYRGIREKWPNFAMKRIAKASDIYPVFRQLFAKGAEATAND